MAQIISRGTFDLAVIGGGIVGLATARQVLLKHPKLRVCVIDKENELASHQSKRNSGVVHCGIYYKKGSLKSKFCIKGASMTKEYCQRKGLPYKQCGKMIVATKTSELETLHKLYNNALANNIEGVEMITPRRVEEIQPGCKTALEAIWSPNTAIVDWQKVALSYASDFEQMGGTIFKNFLLKSLESSDNYTKLVNSTIGSNDFLEARSVVNCAGLFSDHFAELTGNNEHPKVVPFKGNYLALSDRLASSIRTNIYPVPDPKLPFLGVHITPRVDGSVLIGPTSVLTLGYERYTTDIPINPAHLYHIFIRSGLRKMLKNKHHLKAGILELWRLIDKTRITKDVAKFLPDIRDDDLIDINFCGIRAQVMDKDGELVDDFLFETGIHPDYTRILHVRNCPSPAATSSLAIAERVVTTLEDRLI